MPERVRHDGVGLFSVTGSSVIITGGLITAPMPVQETGRGRLVMSAGHLSGDTLSLGGNSSTLVFSGGMVDVNKGFVVNESDDSDAPVNVTVNGAVIRTADADSVPGFASGIVLVKDAETGSYSGKVVGEVTLTEDLILGADDTLYIPEGSTLIVPEGITFQGRTEGPGALDNRNPATADPFAIDTAEVTVANVVWTGKARKPAVKVVIGEKTLKQGADYTVTYANNKNVGTATVTVTAAGEYKGAQQVSFNIVPKATTIKKATASKKAVKITWAKVKAGAKYVEIKYTQKGTDNTKIVKVKASKLSKKITGLKKGKKYVFQVRAVKAVNGVNYFSAWSKSKTKKAK